MAFRATRMDNMSADARQQCDFPEPVVEVPDDRLVWPAWTWSLRLPVGSIG